MYNFRAAQATQFSVVILGKIVLLYRENNVSISEEKMNKTRNKKNISLQVLLFCIVTSLMTISIMAASVSAASPVLGTLSYYARDSKNGNQATKYIATIIPAKDSGGVYTYDLGTIKDDQKPARFILYINDSDGNYDPTTWYNVTSHCDISYSSCFFEFAGFTIQKISPAKKYYGWNPVICDASHTKEMTGGCYDTTTNEYDFLYPYPDLVTPAGYSNISITFTDKDNNTATLFMKVDVENHVPIIIMWLQNFLNRF